MKKIMFLPFCVAVLLSCEKAEMEEDVPAGGTLDKVIAVENGDSSVTQFTYTGGKLTGYTTMEYPAGVAGFTYVFTRDNNGKLTKTSSKEYNYPPYETYITYQPGSSMIKSTVSFENQWLVDSSAFTYTNGLITEHVYRYNGSGYDYDSRIEYTIADGNITRQKEFNIFNGLQTYDAVYTFDSNNGPLSQTIEEAILTEVSDLFVKNNVTKAVYTYPSFPSANETVNRSYTYATSGQPNTAQITWSSGDAGTLKFLYK
jgi:hypothetical protein